jgi:hypothetical protein
MLERPVAVAAGVSAGALRLMEKASSGIPGRDKRRLVAALKTVLAVEGRRKNLPVENFFDKSSSFDYSVLDIENNHADNAGCHHEARSHQQSQFQQQSPFLLQERELSTS